MQPQKETTMTTTKRWKRVEDRRWEGLGGAREKEKSDGCPAAIVVCKNGLRRCCTATKIAFEYRLSLASIVWLFLLLLVPPPPFLLLLFHLLLLIFLFLIIFNISFCLRYSPFPLNVIHSASLLYKQHVVLHALNLYLNKYLLDQVCIGTSIYLTKFVCDKYIFIYRYIFSKERMRARRHVPKYTCATSSWSWRVERTTCFR